MFSLILDLIWYGQWINAVTDPTRMLQFKFIAQQSKNLFQQIFISTVTDIILL